MRVSMSPSGSVIVISQNLLPARLDQAGDEPGRAEVAERNARHPELAVIAARPPGDLAPVSDAHGRGIARQLGELEACLETLLERPRLVIGDCQQGLAPVLELRNHL